MLFSLPHSEWLHSDWMSFCIQSECGKIQTRITANTDTFYAVLIININSEKAILTVFTTPSKDWVDFWKLHFDSWLFNVFINALIDNIFSRPLKSAIFHIIFCFFRFDEFTIVNSYLLFVILLYSFWAFLDLFFKNITKKTKQKKTLDVYNQPIFTTIFYLCK